MTILIGLSPGEKDAPALRLGALLGRSSGEPIVLLAVVPAPWPPNPYGADEEYLRYQEQVARAALDRGAAYLRERSTEPTCLLRRADSVAAGILAVIAERDAEAPVTATVVGSSATGVLGRVMLGGTAERLLHSATSPVVVAPRDFHPGTATEVTRVSVAFGRADHDGALIARAVQAAQHFSASLRVVCFAVRPMAVVASGAVDNPEEVVVDAWMKQLEAEIVTTVAAVGEGQSPPRAAASSALPDHSIDIALGQGGTWADALHDVPWSDGDLLVVGTSTGPLSRIFLGSHAAKIVRNSPVPVVLLNRGDPPA